MQLQNVKTINIFYNTLNINGKKLKTAIRATDLTQEQAAIKLGTTRQTLSQWFKYEVLPQEVLQNVKSNLNIDLIDSNVDRHLTRQDEAMRKDDIPGVPMYNAPAAASGGVEIYTDRESHKVVGHLNFPGVTKGSFALQVFGNSMNPTLQNGDWCVLRPIENRESIDWGQVYYIEWEEYRMFKRLLVGQSDDEVVLWSDNQDEKLNELPIHAPRTIKNTEIRTLCLVTDIYKKSNN